MKDQTFGIEIEMNHITRQKAARVIAATLPSSALGDSATVRHTGGRTYDVWEVTGVDGRVWKVMRDGSIGSGPSAAGPLEEQCEVVSPVCRWDDIPLVQDIVRALAEDPLPEDAGAVAHSSCGIHIHIGLGSHTPQTLRNLVKLQRSFQPHRQLAGRPAHTGAPNQPGAPRLRASRSMRPSCGKYGERPDAEQNWETYRDQHYDPRRKVRSLRYHLLNLHSTFSKGTIEFRAWLETPLQMQQHTPRRGGQELHPAVHGHQPHGSEVGKRQPAPPGHR